jgi:hypothetical protein
MRAKSLALFLVLVLSSVCFAAPCTKRTPTPADGGDYDFIIAGGGTAGSIVAARLANANVCSISSLFSLFSPPRINFNNSFMC